MKQTKILTLLFAILVGQTVLAQKKLPIIKANSTSVDIKDDNNLRKNAWRIGKWSTFLTVCKYSFFN